MAYIVQHNKERKALKRRKNDELKKEHSKKNSRQMKGQNNELTAELEKKKAELDAQILRAESRFLTKDASWLRPKKNCTLCKTNILP